MISLLWTKNNLPASHLIRHITKGKSSHFSIAFDKKIVFESSMTRWAHLSFYSDFIQKNTMVYQLHFAYALELEEQVWQNCASLDGNPYDYLGAIRLGARCLGLQLPDFLNNGKALYCVEVAKTLEPIAHLPHDLTNITPDELFEFLEP